MGEVFDTGGGVQVFRASISRPAAPGIGSTEPPLPPISPTERLRQMKPAGLNNNQKVRAHKKVVSLKPGSDSCYSRSDHSSTSDSESARLSSAIAERLSGETDHAGAGLAGVGGGGGGGLEGGPQGGHDGRPPARGEVRMANQGPPLSRLERLCPRVRTSAPRPSYDSTSLSSVDTSTLSSSSSDLWNVRAMPDVPFSRLSKPLSLRAGARQRPSHLDSLTDELLVKILAYLTSKELMGVARVCRRFYFLAWEPELWERLSFLGEENLDIDRALKTTFQLVSRNGVALSSTVKAISLSGCSRLTDRGLALVARRCHLLQELEIQACPLVTNGGLLDLTSRCHHLNHLDVQACPMVSAVGLAAGESTRHLTIQYLDLSDCPHVDDTSLRLVVESCPQLQFLYLRRCASLSDAGLRAIASYCLLLRELSVSDCPNITDNGLAELGRLGPSLRYLSVAKCDLLTDSGVRTLARHCYRLRYLNLRGCEQVSDSAVDWLSKSCSRLRSLDLGKCDVSDLGLKLLSENCPNLKKLSVKSCALVTDTGVEAVSRYCRGLQHLNIQDVAGVSLQGYRAVRAHCRRCIIEHTNPGFH